MSSFQKHCVLSAGSSTVTPFDTGESVRERKSRCSRRSGCKS